VGSIVCIDADGVFCGDATDCEVAAETVSTLELSVNGTGEFEAFANSTAFALE
jgi:hypothetical protein